MKSTKNGGVTKNAESYQKITSTPKGWSTKPKERLSYYLYFCGQNAIYNLVASFLTTYLMLSIGGLVKTAGIMLAVKVWDAVNDAIFGVLFDKVKFKSGKSSFRGSGYRSSLSR